MRRFSPGFGHYNSRGAKINLIFTPMRALFLISGFFPWLDFLGMRPI